MTFKKAVAQQRLKAASNKPKTETSIQGLASSAGIRHKVGGLSKTRRKLVCPLAGL